MGKTKDAFSPQCLSAAYDEMAQAYDSGRMQFDNTAQLAVPNRLLLSVVKPCFGSWGKRFLVSLISLRFKGDTAKWRRR